MGRLRKRLTQPANSDLPASSRPVKRIAAVCARCGWPVKRRYHKPTGNWRRCSQCSALYLSIAKMDKHD